MYFKQLTSISCTLISMKIGQFHNPFKYIRCVTKYISKAVTHREARAWAWDTKHSPFLSNSLLTCLVASVKGGWWVQVQFLVDKCHQGKPKHIKQYLWLLG